MNASLWVLSAMWLVLLFEPHWFLAANGAGFVLRLPIVLLMALTATLGLGVLTGKEWVRRWTWYAPLSCFVALHVMMVPVAPDPFLAWAGALEVITIMIVVLATVAFADGAPRAEQWLTVYALQFLFWGGYAATGYVPWHTTLSNYDGYGSWMVIGGGLCGFMLMGSDRPRLRLLLGIAVGLCAIGVVASFARGAFLSAVVVAFYAWLRSPRKGRTLAVGIVCALVGAVTAAIIYGDAYWAEMATIAQGAEEETADQRAQLWSAAWLVFLEHPLFGAGPNNWGVVAGNVVPPGMLGGTFGNNPRMLYGVSLHSSYFQILSEQGLAGVFVFGWILVDFWRRNLKLRTAAAARRWRELGGRFRINAIALGLEAAMIGWLVNASLYSMSGKHWLYSILGLNLLFFRLVTAGSGNASRATRPRSPAYAVRRSDSS